MKTFETSIIIEIKGKIKSSEFNSHVMDEVDKIIAAVRKNNPIKISIDGELGELIEFTEEPNLKINLDNIKVTNDD